MLGRSLLHCPGQCCGGMLAPSLQQPIGTTHPGPAFRGLSVGWRGWWHEWWALHSINRLPAPAVLHGGTKSIYVDTPGCSLSSTVGIFWALSSTGCTVLCVHGLEATAEPAVVFTLPAWACASWCQHKSPCSHLEQVLWQCLLWPCDAQGRAGAHADELLGACELTHGVFICG